jgi:hypothetical protein
VGAPRSRARVLAATARMSGWRRGGPTVTRITRARRRRDRAGCMAALWGRLGGRPLVFRRR